jgi:hypothetical protein
MTRSAVQSSAPECSSTGVTIALLPIASTRVWLLPTQPPPNVSSVTVKSVPACTTSGTEISALIPEYSMMPMS